MTDDIVAQGLELMLYGMGTVVVFLALLVVVTTVMSGFVGRFFPEPSPPTPARPQQHTAAAAPEGEVIAAITAAISQHRNRKQ